MTAFEAAPLIKPPALRGVSDFSPTGDVAAFEINKHDFADVIDVLQAKTGLKVKLESVSH